MDLYWRTLGANAPGPAFLICLVGGGAFGCSAPPRFLIVKTR